VELIRTGAERMAEPAKKILLVEDEILIAMAEAEMLKANGYDVSLAGSGEEAVRLIMEGQHIDLILMDIDLGKGMDGTQAASKILAHQDVPVLFLSSHTEPDIVNKTETITSYGYVVKNSGDTILLASIKMAFKLNKAYTTINIQNQDIAESNEELQATIEELTATNEEFEAQNEELITSQQEIMSRDKALRESENYLKHIINNAPFGTHFYDLKSNSDLIFRGANASADTMLGIDHSTLIGKTLLEIFPGLKDTEVPQKYDECARTGSVYQNESIYYNEGKISGAFDIRAFGTTQNSMAVFFTDITKRKIIEDKLKKNEEELLSVFDNAAVGIAYVSPDGIYLRANKCFCEIIGYSQEEAQTLNFQSITHPDDIHIDFENRKKIFSNEVDDYTIVKRYIRKDSRIIWVKVYVSVKRKNDNSISHYISVVEDITEHKKIEDDFKQTLELYHLVTEYSEDVIWLLDLETNKFIYVSPSVKKLRGYTPEEVYQQPMNEVLTPESLALVSRNIPETIDALIRGDEASIIKNTIIYQPCKNGSVVPTEVTTSFIADNQGRYTKLLGVSRNITERIAMESELASHQRLIERAQRIVNIGYWIFDLAKKTVFASKESRNIYGLGDNEWNIKETQKIPLSQYREMLDTSLKNLIEKNAPYDVTFKIKRKNDGAIIDIHSIAEYDKSQNKVFGIIQDVTEQKRIEESLQISEDRYKRISEVILDYIFTTYISDGKAIKTIHAPGCINVTGYSSDDFARDPYLWFTMVYHEDRPFVEEMARQALVRKNIEPYEHRIIHKDGLIRWVKNTTLPHYNDAGILTSIDGLVEDITERKNMEEAIRESETKYRQLIENLNDIVWSTDASLHLTYISSVDEKIRGYSADEVLGKQIFDFLKPEFVEMARPAVSERIRMLKEKKTIGIATYVAEMLCKDGRYIWVEITSSPTVSKTNELLGFQGIIRDITFKKDAEEALTYSNEYIKSLFNSVDDAIFVQDGRTGTIIDVNKRTCEMYGYAYEEIVSSDIDTFSLGTSPYSLKESKEWLEKAKADGPQNFEWIARRKDKTVFWVDITILYTKIGHDEKFVVTVRDISERKHAENLLRQSESLLKDSQRVAHLGHYIFNITMGTWSNSETLDNIFGIKSTYKKDELGWGNIIHPYKKDLHGWLLIIHPDDREAMTLYLTEYVLKQHNQFDKEYRIVRINDQQTRWVHGLGNLSFDKNGNVIEMFGTIQDITEKKEAELALASAVKEKEELLRELNHRVKNSLSMITGLVGLEKNQTQNSELKKSLETLRHRIVTISNLYTMLDSRQQETDLRLDIYLRTISESIYASYISESKKITITTDMKSLRIDVKRAATVGLILNELLTNAFKYAFPERGGIVHIVLADDNDNYSLSVIDDGVGLPENFDPQGKTGIGMKLIQLLAQQMNGTVTCSSNNKTEFNVSFPKNQ
jgi:PAS domain S-box-containing protein